MPKTQNKNQCSKCSTKYVPPTGKKCKRMDINKDSDSMELQHMNASSEDSGYAVVVKNLGVWFDANFSFANHVRNICSQAG